MPFCTGRLGDPEEDLPLFGRQLDRWSPLHQAVDKFVFPGIHHEPVLVRPADQIPCLKSLAAGRELVAAFILAASRALLLLGLFIAPARTKTVRSRGGHRLRSRRERAVHQIAPGDPGLAQDAGGHARGYRDLALVV